MANIRTYKEFQNFLLEKGTPSCIVVDAKDYSVIEQKFVHRSDRFSDGGGRFCVAYLDAIKDKREWRQPVIIREGPRNFWITVDHLGCE